MSIRMFRERIHTERASSQRSHAVTDLPYVRIRPRPRVYLSFVGSSPVRSHIYFELILLDPNAAEPQ